MNISGAEIGDDRCAHLHSRQPTRLRLEVGDGHVTQREAPGGHVGCVSLVWLVPRTSIRPRVDKPGRDAVDDGGRDGRVAGEAIEVSSRLRRHGDGLGVHGRRDEITDAVEGRRP